MLPPITPHPLQFLLFESRVRLIVFLILFQFSGGYSHDLFASGPDSVYYSGINTFILENADSSYLYKTGVDVGAIACNDHVTIYPDTLCSITLYPEMFLEGDIDGWHDYFELNM
ncbi:MAG: hypothetical protein ACI86M_001005 [Saprospiraceae bacterium]|jgi:hypothetical protein